MGQKERETNVNTFTNANNSMLHVGGSAWPGQFTLVVEEPSGTLGASLESITKGRPEAKGPHVEILVVTGDILHIYIYI